MNIWQNRNWSPMLLKEINKPFDSKDYLFEIKFDGIRACIFVSPNEFQIISRNNHDLTDLYPELKQIQKLVKKKTILDGEIVAMENGKPSFSKLQERSHLKNKDKIIRQAFDNPVIFVGFDILFENKDLTKLPLSKRKEYLNKLSENEVFLKSKVFPNEGIKLFKQVKRLNLEGIVAKIKNSSYEINTRSNNWIKIKNNHEEKFLIGGYEEKKGYVVSLLLGEVKNDSLYYVGHVTLGKKYKLYEELIRMNERKKSPFIDYNNAKAIYVKPKLSCCVCYLERTKSNHLRQPFIKNRG